jgi:hypothetical protein
MIRCAEEAPLTIGMPVEADVLTTDPRSDETIDIGLPLHLKQIPTQPKLILRGIVPRQDRQNGDAYRREKANSAHRTTFVIPSQLRLG